MVRVILEDSIKRDIRPEVSVAKGVDRPIYGKGNFLSVVHL